MTAVSATGERALADGESSKAGELRASSYNIYVDLPNDQDHLLLLHGYTGAYDRVSRAVGAFVRSRESRNVPKPLYGVWTHEEIDGELVSLPSQVVIEHLKKRGFLTTKSLEEEEAFFIKIVGAIRKQQALQMPSYVVMPSYDCNLRCHYCFQDFMRTDPSYNHLLRTMSFDVADRILKSLTEIETKHHSIEDSASRERNFTLFGGEPLTQLNQPVVAYFIEKARQLGRTRFGAITNGTQLQAYANLLNQENISWLQITIDGPPAEHDKRRIRADGSGSFAAIHDGIDLALAADVDVVIRVNVDRSSSEALPELAATFKASGWDDNKRFSCYVAPVRDSLNKGVRGDYFNTHELSEEVRRLQAEHPDMARINAPDLGMRATALAIFKGEREVYPTRTTFCGAHSGMYVFDPFGDIYACWERTGNKNIRMGYVDDEGRVVMNLLSSHWRDRDVTSNKTCLQCRFSLHCGGGCAILAEEASGSMYSNFCDAFGKRLRSRIAEAYEQFQAGCLGTETDLITGNLEAFVR